MAQKDKDFIKELKKVLEIPEDSPNSAIFVEIGRLKGSHVTYGGANTGNPAWNPPYTVTCERINSEGASNPKQKD